LLLKLINILMDSVKKHKYTKYLIGLLIASLGLFYLVFNQSLKLNQLLNPKIRVGFTHEVFETASLVAFYDSLFEKQKIEVEIAHYNSCIEAMESGLLIDRLEITGCEITPIVTAFLKKHDVKIISLMARADDQIYILSNKSSGINSIKDLANKTVALEKGSAAHYFLSNLLDQNQIDYQKVKLQFSNIGKLTDLLANNKVSAVVVEGPYVGQIKKALKDNLMSINPKNLYKSYAFVAKNSFIKRHPQKVIAFLRAIKEATVLIENDKPKVLSVIKEDPLISIDFIETQINTTYFNLFLDDILVSDIESQAGFVIAEKIVDELTVPDMKEIIYSQALKKVNPAAMYLDY